jgi:hypothetical protein
MLFVWWVPDEFWLASFAQDETVTEKDIKEFMDSVSKYTVVGVVDGIVGNMGGVTYRSEEENRKRIKVKDAQGVYYSPLVKKQVDADVRSFSAMLKAALAEQLGEMGKNMQFFFFPAKTKDGSRFASPTQTGKFTVKLGDEEMHWKLPLASLLVPKNCPKCSESLHGGYSFCPWDGTKLP